MERGVCIRIEEAIESIQGIDKVNTTASEGVCSVAVEVTDGFDSASVANDIKSQVDGINTLPTETEKPVTTKFLFRGGVMQIMLTGNADERT